MDDTQLLELCREYQKLLRMEDWRVGVKVVHKDELPDKSAMGYSECSAESRDAAVLILHPDDFIPIEHLFNYDLEQILVHELLHIKFYMVDVEGNVELEFAIDSTAEALTHTRRLSLRDSS